jgi:hypothetical protein
LVKTGPTYVHPCTHPILALTPPQNGEIDIVEGVNDQTTNIMTLHTGAGASIQSKSTTASFSGNITTTDCDVNAPNQPTNAGCAVHDTSDLSFGAGFNAAGGGVYATEWTSNFIKIWFFPRDSIPSDVAAGTPQPSDAWGTPASMFSGDFNLDDHFKDLNIIFDTTFCGQWAGPAWSSSPQCAALAPSCEEYVSNNPQAFTEAYWAINTLKVFQDDSVPQEAGANQTAPVAAAVRRRGGAVLPIHPVRKHVRSLSNV